MNKRHIKSNLNETMEQLQEILSSLKNEELDEVALQIQIEHVYHHINTAWNARNANEKEAYECNESNFKKWQQFPSDLEFLE